jgi:hypothetical protein
MTSTVPSGSRRMKRVKPGMGLGAGTSESASAAMPIMNRARSSKPRTSAGLCAMGRPICRVISQAMRSRAETKASTARPSRSARSATGTLRHAACAWRARFSTLSSSAEEVQGRSTTTAPSMGEIVRSGSLMDEWYLT